MTRRPRRRLWAIVVVFLLGAALLAGLADVVSAPLRRAVAESVIPAGD